jgi:hypothetical protein
MSVTLKVTGNFNNTEKLLNRLKGLKIGDILQKYGQLGVEALRAATPEATGLTAESWGFEVSTTGGNSYTITWTNSHENEGVNIAAIIQYGHGTGTGGYISGRDYINPAMRPVFDQIATNVWKEVTAA